MPNTSSSTIFVKAAAAALLLGLASGCAKQEAAPAVDTAKISDAVKGDVAGLIAAFNAHDAAKAVSYDTDDYLGMMHGMPDVVGKDADLKVTTEQTGDPAAKVDVSDEQVDVAKAGDMAIYRATYDYTYTDPQTKKPTTEHGNWVLGWKTQADGSWKLAWSVISDKPAPAAADASPAT